MATGQKTVRGLLAEKYLLKFPRSSKNTIARQLVRDYPALFKDQEDARFVVRFKSGKAGKNSTNTHNPNYIKHDTNFSSQNPYGLPESDETVYEPYILPKVNNNIGLLYDIHNPFHSIQALNCAIKYLLEKKINTLIIAGDGMDCYRGSRFIHDHKKMSLKEELDSMQRMLQTFKKIFPKTKIFYLEGNHEKRWEILLRTKAPEICDIDEFQLDVILGLRPMGITWVKDKRIIKAGKLNIIHGHEFVGGGSGGVNPARALYLKAKKSSIEGHFHQTSEHTETSPTDGDIVTCFSVGSLCELHPDYMPLNKWNHGFAHVTVKDNGTFSVKNLRIKDGVIL